MQREITCGEAFIECFTVYAKSKEILLYRKPFKEVWEEEKDDPILGPLSERMGVVNPRDGRSNVSAEEMEAASFYHAFCFYKI